MAPGEQGLPGLPTIVLSLYRGSAQLDPVPAALEEILRQCVGDSLAALKAAPGGQAAGRRAAALAGVREP
jgi:hypothetical protein